MSWYPSAEERGGAYIDQMLDDRRGEEAGGAFEAAQSHRTERAVRLIVVKTQDVSCPIQWR